MKRVISVFIAVVTLLLLVIPASAASYTVYDGTIGTTYLDYFEGIAYKFSPKVHYVVYRVDQYSYYMAYGEELTNSGSNFTGSVSLIKYTVGSYNSNNSLSYSTDSSFNLNAGDDMVYTDLSDRYPALINAGYDEFKYDLHDYALVICVILVSTMFIYIGFNVIRKRWIV